MPGGGAADAVPEVTYRFVAYKLLSRLTETHSPQRFGAGSEWPPARDNYAAPVSSAKNGFSMRPAGSMVRTHFTRSCHCCP